ncbi:hypothetical protein AQJ66_20015 [Streptomyces bungoensis]|uniref:Proteinase inhibitor I42 chagasin domain-containing protein n=1 Tax=Streptomyces bungoensis TaxID=285568 RepID=A0A101T0B4_9ACTN|nr:hypothetical protein [Streptomyces bungoensis]KUN83179.1 hypothetical protein AQJ66_20015 [Streptomyces bungoensis]
MRRTTPLAITAAALLLAACGSQSDGTGGRGGNDKVSPSSSPSSAASPAASPGGTGCVTHLELTAADTGRTVCLTKGGELRLTLDGTRARPWKPVDASGPALKGINAGFVIQPGDATAAYQAVTSGTTELTSSRPLCATPTAPGQVSCKGLQEWTVTVRVR